MGHSPKESPRRTRSRAQED